MLLRISLLRTLNNTKTIKLRKEVGRTVFLYKTVLITMYLSLKINLETHDLIVDGDNTFMNNISHDIFDTKVLPYVFDKLHNNEKFGGIVFPYDDKLYRMLYTINEKICDVILIDGTFVFDGMEKFMIDPLTKLFDKVSLLQEMNDRLNTPAMETEQQLLLIDIDSFRRVNDVIGREGSDAILKEFSSRLQELPGVFFLYRYSGDCFAILRTGKKLDKFVQGIKSLLDTPFDYKGKNTYLTVSIGSIDILDFADTTAETLLEYTEIALNVCRSKGKNGWVRYSSDLKERDYLELEMEGMIRDGLKTNQFVLYYQPQYSFSENKFVGAEALIRWNHPTKGFVSPGEFIPIAERSGLVVNLGEWVINEACRQQREWLDKGYSIVKVGVNIGSLHFKKPDFIEDIRDALEKYNLPAQSLGLEITEGSVIDDVDDMIQKLEQLREMGVHVSIDDFGTGYSSLSYLKKFKIDTLKIDQSFVMNMEEARDDIAIVRAIIDLAKNLNIKVIAEGVENDSVRDLLIEMSCTDMQGYLVSRPVANVEFEKNLQKTSINLPL